jgi:hypothetical protein
MSDIFKIAVCEGCGEQFPEAQMKRHDGLLYCKKCYKAINPPKQRAKKEQAEDAEPVPTGEKKEPAAAAMPSSLAVTIEAPALADAISRSMSQAFANPIRIEFAPVRLELVGGGAITMPLQVPGPVPAQPPVAAPSPVHRQAPTVAARGRPYVDSSILRVMGAKRRKWRPAELASELQLLDQPVTATEDDIARALERLARPSPDAKEDEQVVQLSTRYMRRDLFVVEDEVDFIDLMILKILAAAGSKGAPATAIHAAAELCNLVPVALPTVLNHLRALKAPGWELVEKVGTALRDNYAITAKGTGLLADAEDAVLGSYTAEWRERLDGIGVFTSSNALADKADILTTPVREVIVKHASKADKALIVAHMEQKLDPAATKAHGRKIAALKLLGF